MVLVLVKAEKYYPTRPTPKATEQQKRQEDAVLVLVLVLRARMPAEKLRHPKSALQMEVELSHRRGSLQKAESAHLDLMRAGAGLMGTRARARHRLFRPWLILRILRAAWCRVLGGLLVAQRETPSLGGSQGSQNSLVQGHRGLLVEERQTSNNLEEQEREYAHELMLAALLGEPGCHGPAPRATSEPDGGLV